MDELAAMVTEKNAKTVKKHFSRMVDTVHDLRLNAQRIEQKTLRNSLLSFALCIGL